MANLIYKRVATDQQSTDRQNLVLDEASIEEPVVFEEESGTPVASTRFSARSSASCSRTRGRVTPCTSPRCAAWCELVSSLNSEVTVVDLAEDIAEIGYPQPVRDVI